MKPYLLKNTDEQHEERLALVAYYSKVRGKRMYYSDILHELQHEKLESFRRAENA